MMSEEDIITVFACVLFSLCLLWLLAWGIAAYAKWKMLQAIKNAPPQEIRDLAYQDWIDTLVEQEFMV